MGKHYLPALAGWSGSVCDNDAGCSNSRFSVDPDDVGSANDREGFHRHRRANLGLTGMPSAGDAAQADGVSEDFARWPVPYKRRVT